MMIPLLAAALIEKQDEQKQAIERRKHPGRS